MDRQDWAQGLQGMGAWFQGQGPQYMNAQSVARRTRAVEDGVRREAMLKDGRTALLLGSQGKWGEAQGLLQNRMDLVNQLGGDPSGTASMLRMVQEGRHDEALMELKTADDMAVMNGELPAMGGREHTPSEIEKLHTYRNSLPDGSEQQKQVDAVIGSKISSQGPHASAKTHVWDNGTLMQVMSDGKRRVFGPDGTEVFGDDAKDVLKDARDEQVSHAGAKTQATEGAKSTAKAAADAYESLAPIRKYTSNLDRAIMAIDKGANTGTVMSKLPSIRDASKELDSAMRSIGLDIVGMVTFGALSKGELDVAMADAVPQEMDPPQLRAWLIERRNAQRKIYDYALDAAMFMSTPGNTMNDWMRAQEESLRSAVAPGPASSAPPTSSSQGVKFLGFE